MEIKSVFDKEFTPYGQVYESYELSGLLAHPDAAEAEQGACVGLSSGNIDLN